MTAHCECTHSLTKDIELDFHSQIVRRGLHGLRVLLNYHATNIPLGVKWPTNGVVFPYYSPDNLMEFFVKVTLKFHQV